MTRPVAVVAFVLGAWVALGLREVLSRTWLNRTPAEAQRVAAMRPDAGVPPSPLAYRADGKLFAPAEVDVIYRTAEDALKANGLGLTAHRRDGGWPL